jgi:GNAT superfamily N-acetyltransferase
VKVRRVARGDWQAVRSLRLQALESDLYSPAFRAEWNGYSDIRWEQECTRWADSAIEAMFVAEMERNGSQTLAGICWASTGEFNGGETHGKLFVLPEYRRFGVGRFLVEFANDWAKWAAKGLETLACSIVVGNGGSEKLHASLGYRPVGDPSVAIVERLWVKNVQVAA